MSQRQKQKAAKEERASFFMARSAAKKTAENRRPSTRWRRRLLPRGIHVTYNFYHLPGRGTAPYHNLNEAHAGRTS
ncbi:Hypothetical predicted protein [Pelobates cultripes]|uniref:Uncharacterized protein n=1 Tax=Pelobates cultripes TaxID=61616 RepID=A0AAD1WL57_PELCU|nr:Hypothetical predicted protein [Pelobates cultripes]